MDEELVDLFRRLVLAVERISEDVEAIKVMADETRGIDTWSPEQEYYGDNCKDET